MAMFTEGALVAGKYRIDRILGRGGMGVVAAATHVHLHQRVALKFMQPEYAADRNIVERFAREARAAAALRGEHVCRVSDVGALDNGAPYLVMELLEGTDLAQLVTTGGPIPVPRACGYVLQACIGVAEAHALGIVHRDLKPANLFLAQRPDGTPVVKVLDFGIAKAQGTDPGDFSLTRTSSVLGSPGYMSPEQLRSSRDVDLRTDIWSLGVILFELVSGRPPFTAQTITELAIRVTMDPRPPFIGAMPHGFDQVVDRCLAKDPAHRFPELASLAQALALYAGPEGAELAHRVARLVHAVPNVAIAAPAHAGGVAPTAPPTGFAAAPVPTTVAPSPTTLGSSAASLAAAERPRTGHRWGVIASVSLGLVAALVTYIALSGDPPVASPGASTPAAAPQPPPQPPPPAAVTPDAAVAAVPADAAVAAVPADAEVAAAPADAEVVAEPADTAPAPPTRKKVVKKKPAQPATEDFGASRF